MINSTIEKLIAYAYAHLALSEYDETYLRNYLYFTLDVKLPEKVNIDISSVEKMTRPDEIVNELTEFLLAKGLSSAEADKKITQIFGFLTPMPSKVIAIFDALYNESPERATEWFYDLCVKNNYVQKSKIEQNIIINPESGQPDVEITINLSKPEKNNKDIAKVKNATVDNYPACAICIENEGCYGSEKTPPRNNIRLIPLTLNNSEWYLQYSPYGYYNEHCIVIKKEHEPMDINLNNIKALFDFVDLFPHYFLGSNSCLPIVGGSILNHEHFQGGKHEMPMMRAKDLKCIELFDKTVNASILDWPSFVLKLVGKSKESVVNAADKITHIWNNYSDPSVNVVSNDGVQHNTCTVIARKIDEQFVCYIIPRNNMTDEEHPGGIFHVRNDNQAIKNEGIGLIEAMGLFILPSRLKRQLSLLENMMEDETKIPSILAEYPDMAQFNEVKNRLANKQYKNINDLLIHVGYDILQDISVFKADQKGKEASSKFVELLK